MYVHPLEALLDEHWYDIARQFDYQHSMCHCNSGLHGQQGPTRHQSSAGSNTSRSETSQQSPNSIFSLKMIESGKGHAAPSSTQFAIIREDVMRGKKQAIDSITLKTAALLFSFFSTSSTFFLLNI